MLSEKIKSIHAFLGSLAHRVPEDVWQDLRKIRLELADAEELARRLECGLLPQQDEERPILFPSELAVTRQALGLSQTSYATEDANANSTIAL